MKSIFTTAGIALVGLAILLFMFGTLVPPGYFGVRQIKFGPGQGFRPTGLSPGLHWAVPFYSTVHIVPQTVQMVHFHSERREGRQQMREAMASGMVFPALEIQSADRATVDVDVSILYSFFPERGKAVEVPGSDASGSLAQGIEHGGPADLFKLGITQESWRNEVRRRAEDQLKRKLGLLQTSKFYTPDAREPLIEEAQTEINQALAPSGIVVQAVLLRRFSYREDRIDNAIFQKNLQEQEERRNVAQGKFVEVEGLVKKVEAEKNAEIETIRVQGESNAKVIRSEGDLYEAQRRAQADLLVAKAQAESDKLRAVALSQSAGSQAYVARELAPLVSSLKGGIVSGVDPYDLNAWAKKLGGGGAGSNEASR